MAKKKEKREREREREREIICIYIYIYMVIPCPVIPGYPLRYEPLHIKRKGEILLLRYNWSSI